MSSGSNHVSLKKKNSLSCGYTCSVPHNWTQLCSINSNRAYSFYSVKPDRTEETYSISYDRTRSFNVRLVLAEQNLKVRPSATEQNVTNCVKKNLKNTILHSKNKKKKNLTVKNLPYHYCNAPKLLIAYPWS